MPTISVSSKLTLPVPNQDFGSFSQEIGFWGIDVEGDVEAQVAACVAAIDPAASAAQERLAQEAANLSGITLEGLGLSKEFTNFKDRMTNILNRVVKEVTRHKGDLDKLDIPALAKQFGVNVEVDEKKAPAKKRAKASDKS